MEILVICVHQGRFTVCNAVHFSAIWSTPSSVMFLLELTSNVFSEFACSDEAMPINASFVMLLQYAMLMCIKIQRKAKSTIDESCTSV